MKVSILHLSDLHRDPHHPVSNDALLNSLVRDIRDSVHEDPPIALPEIIIVSGDIVQGTGKDTADPHAVLSAQYEQAQEFLGKLADEFVGGDRSRVVVVPGNHDISFPSMFASLESVDYLSIDPRKRSELAELIRAHDSVYRWSWTDFALHKIRDQRTYADRLRNFIVFYESFYGGHRPYSELPEDNSISLVIRTRISLSWVSIAATGMTRGTSKVRYIQIRRHAPSRHSEAEDFGAVSGSRYGITAPKGCRNVMITWMRTSFST